MADQVGHDEETHIKIKPDSLTNQRLLGIRCKGMDKMAHLQSSVFKLSKDLIDSIHEEGIVAYTS